MSIRYFLLFLGAAALLCAEPAVDTTKIQKAFGKVPLHFEPVGGSAAFSARGQGYSFQVTAQEARLQVNGSAVRMRLAGANPAASIAAVDPLPGRVNYLIGKDPSQWRRDVPTYSRVQVTGVYPGVDLVYYGNQKQLEYDLVLAPGADPTALAMEFDGIESLRVGEDGALILKTTEGEIRWRRPEVFQEKGGKRVAVASEYAIRGSKRVGFTLGAHDASAALTIDPILEYSTVLGGDGSTDIALAIAVDSLGQAYVVGYTNRPDFPLQSGLPGGYQGGNDVFITKLNATGTGVIFSTYVGGTGDEVGRAVALDGANPPNIYVTGETNSVNFPVVGGPQSTLGGSLDAFVVKLSASGNQILYSSYHGGDGFDRGFGIGVHLATGTAYIAGDTQSTNFPLANALQSTKGSTTEGFVAKYSAAGNTRLFSTYMGGNNTDIFYALAVDVAGNVYVAGQTISTDYPTTNPLQAAKAGTDWDCMVTALTPNGSARIYSTYLGGIWYDSCFGIAVDSTNSVYVTGPTRLGAFPTTSNAYQRTFEGVEAAFVAKLGPGGTQLVYSTYLASSGYHRSNAIAVDSSGRAHIAGETRVELGNSSLGGTSAGKFGPSTPTFRAGPDGTFLALDSGSAVGFEGERTIRVLAYQTPSSLWAGSDFSAVYRSSDNGLNWNSISSTGFTGAIRAFAFSGANNIWVGTSENVYFSSNNGSTWVSRKAGLPTTPVVAELAVSPTDPNLLLLHTGGAPGLYRSTNGGVSWSATAVGFSNSSLGTILFNPANPSEVLLGRNGGLMRSLDAGVTWTAFGTGLSGGTVTHIIRHASTPNLLFASDGGRLVISTDGGASWTRNSTLPVPNIQRIAVSPTDAQVLLVNTTNAGAWRSTNQGQTWVRASRGDAAIGNDIVFHPSLPNVAVMSVTVRLDGFAARLSADGSVLEFLTHIGTAEWEQAFGVATDASGNTYAVGSTDGTSFPTTAGAVRRTARGTDAFAVKILPEANPPCSYVVTPPLVTLYPFSSPQFGSAFGVVAPGGCAWTATSSATWLTILAGESSSGAGEVRFALAPNTAAANRSATLTVAGTSFTIQQSGTTCESNQSLSGTVSTATAAGGTVNTTLVMPAGCPWTARSSASWITLPTAAGTGNTTVPIVIAPNPGVFSRVSRVDIGPRNFTVTQAGSCTATFTPNSAVLDALAFPTGQFSLNIGAGCNWTLTVPSWLTLTSPSSGTGPTTVAYSVAANPDPISRSGNINGAGVNHTVTQNAATCTYTFPTTARNLSPVAAEGSFNVVTQAACLRAATSNQSWLTLSGNTTTGTGNVFFFTQGNTGTTARSAIISLGGQTITVNQAGIPAATPAVFVPSPASGSGLTRAFTFTFADGNSAADLNVLNVLINSALDGRNACYMAYVRSINTVFLVPDNGEGLLPGVVTGVAGAASNSQCTVNGTGSSVSTSGTTLTLTLDMTFTASFAGNKVVYQAARDLAGNNSGWTTLGVWNVPSSAVTAPNVPTATSMTPARYSGTRTTYSFVFTDPNGFADLNVLNILVNSALDGLNACYMAYVRPTNTLYLVPDNGDGLIAPGIFPDGGAGVTENSQCRILAQGSSVTTSGNNLTLTLNLEFKTLGGRDRLFYLAARDAAANNSNWQVMGSVSAQ